MQKWADCSLTRSSRSRLSIPHSVDSTLTIPVFGRIEPYVVFSLRLLRLPSAAPQV